MKDYLPQQAPTNLQE